MIPRDRVVKRERPLRKADTKYISRHQGTHLFTDASHEFILIPFLTLGAHSLIRSSRTIFGKPPHCGYHGVIVVIRCSLSPPLVVICPTHEASRVETSQGAIDLEFQDLVFVPAALPNTEILLGNPYDCPLPISSSETEKVFFLPLLRIQ